MKRLLTAITMAAAFGAVPAHAEDEEDIGILAALGLTAAEGKTEVSDKGAELEGWMLASGTLANAAQAIVKVKNTERLNVAVPASDAIAARPATATTPAIEARNRVEARPLILLSGETKFDLGAYYSATGSIGAAQAQLNKAAITCDANRAGGGARTLDSSTATDTERSRDVRLMNALIGAAKVDTKMTGFDIGTPDAALLNLIAGHFRQNARIPSDAIGSIDENSPLAKAYDGLVRKTIDVEQCAETMPAGTEEQKKKKATVEAAVTSASGVAKALIAFDKDAGSSLLNRALLAEPYLNDKFDVLRVKVEKGGGNLITRKNIFLQFGFPGALAVTAGTIVSYRYYTPSTGSVLAAGLLVCRASERSWHAINAGKLGAEDCQDAGTVAKSLKR